MTIHRALAGAVWYDWDLRRLNTEGEKRITADAIVIDEASMVDTEVLATLVRAVDWSQVVRLVLVGDYHQLPPIGLGRPFYDLVAELRINEDKYREGSKDNPPDARFLGRLSELKENHRVLGGSRAAALANSYARKAEADEAEIFAALAAEKDQDDLRVRFWEKPEQLHDLVLKEISALMASESSLRNSGDNARFNAIIGHSQDFNLSFWQMPTPVRGEAPAFGTYCSARM